MKKGGMLRKCLIFVGVALAGIVAYNMFPKVKEKIDALLTKVGIKKS